MAENELSKPAFGNTEELQSELSNILRNSISITGNEIDVFTPTFITYGNVYLKEESAPKVKKNVSFHVEKYVKSFTGRTKELETLYSSLEDAKQVVIYGMGGIGKSELARYYAIDKKENYYDSIIWINAENFETLKNSFQNLAKEIDIKIEKNNNPRLISFILQDIYEYFDDKSCLLVFDNAIQMTDLVDFLPQRQITKKFFHILITSRNKEWGTLKSIPLDVLSETDSIKLIENILNPHYDVKKDIKNIIKLSTELQCLPLAIQQAAAFIADIIQYEDRTYTIEQYLEAFEKEEVLLDPEIENPFPHYSENKYDKTVNKTLQISFDKIRSDTNCGMFALKLLNISALLTSDYIPKKIFSPVLNSENENLFNDALRVIAKYSIINLEVDHFSIHRLVQKILIAEQKRNKSLDSFLLLGLHIVVQENCLNTTHNQSVLKIAQKSATAILSFMKKSQPQQMDLFLFSLCLNGHLEALRLLYQNRWFLFVDRLMLCAACHNGHVEVIKFLLEKGASVTCKLSNDNTPILFAALQGHFEAVKCLVENGANVNDIGLDNLCPLYAAVALNHLDMVKYLIRNNANINVPDDNLSTPLHMAVYNKNLPITKFLINTKKATINAKDCDGCTPLHVAVIKNDLNIGKFLILKGAEVNEKNQKGMSPFTEAIYQGYEEFVKLLFENGGLLNGEICQGLQPLHLAANRGHENIVDFLLKNGTEITEDSDGFLPVHVAAMNGHQNVIEYFINNPALNHKNQSNKHSVIAIAAEAGYLELVKYLTDKGFSTTQKNKDGFTPLHYATKNGHMDIVKYLIRTSINIDETGDKGITSLHWAVTNGHLEVVKLLLENDADMYSKTNEKFSAIHIAAEYGFLDIFKYLHKQGVGLEYRIKEGGMMPLFIASAFGKLDIVEFLIDESVPVDIKTHEDVTPLHGAAMRGHLKVVECLVENGASVNALTTYGESVVMKAARYNHLDVIKYLVEENDASIHHLNPSGAGALHFATLNGHLDVVKYLIKKGVSIYVRDLNGCLPFHQAINDGRLEIVKEFVSEDKTLINNNILGENTAPIIQAVNKGHIAIVKYLIQNGASVSTRTVKEMCPIHISTRDGNHQLTKLLVENGAAIDEPMLGGLTPLMFACEQNQLRTVKYLIEKKVTYNKYSFEYTPLKISAIMGHAEIVEELVIHFSIENRDWYSSFLEAMNKKLILVCCTLFITKFFYGKSNEELQFMFRRIRRNIRSGNTTVDDEMFKNALNLLKKLI